MDNREINENESIARQILGAPKKRAVDERDDEALDRVSATHEASL